MVVVVAVVATIALIAITVLIVVIVILQAMLPERLSFSQLIRKGLVLCPLKTRLDLTLGKCTVFVISHACSP